MISYKRIFSLALSLLLVAGLHAQVFASNSESAAAKKPQGAYVKITDIGTINNRSSVGNGINVSGAVAGFSCFTGTIGYPGGPPAEPFLSHAVLFSNGVLQDLGALEGYKTCSPLGCQSQGFDINNSNWVVGASDGDYGQMAMLWLPAAVPGAAAGWNILPPLSLYQGAVAQAINNPGQIVGRASNDSMMPRAVRWTLEPSGAQLMDLGTLRADGSGAGIGYDINDLGQIVGAATNETNYQKPFLFLPTPAYGLPAGMNDLMPAIEDYARAVSVNNKGEVACEIELGVPGIWLPVPAYGLQSGFSLLPLSGKIVAFFPSSISDSGQIAGIAYIEVNPHMHDYVQRAAVWRNGKWKMLNDMLPAQSSWELISADSISRVGKTTLVTGDGWRYDMTDVNGYTPVSHGYVLDVTCTGDLDDDGDVDADDQKVLMGYFGQTVQPGTNGDLNGDGVVNQEDVNLLATQIHKPCL